ncbi:MAG: hypothetical protein K0U98_23675 [Deltaproteobacteria bacterium]|nr:hypothetical protein [Deltaproteobacteria bacterium]
MIERRTNSWRLRIGALVLAGSAAFAPVGFSDTCYGTWYDYYETSDCEVLVGSKVSCPGFPDQVDAAEDGSFIETPFFVSGTAICPCGGGGSGDGEDGEAG